MLALRIGRLLQLRSSSDESDVARNDGEHGVPGAGDVNDAASDASMQQSRSSDSGELNDEVMQRRQR